MIKTHKNVTLCKWNFTFTSNCGRKGGGDKGGGALIRAGTLIRDNT